MIVHRASPGVNVISAHPTSLLSRTGTTSMRVAMARGRSQGSGPSSRCSNTCSSAPRSLCGWRRAS
eukprot:1460115-Prorocentrum_lima.AAC.1